MATPEIKDFVVLAGETAAIGGVVGTVTVLNAVTTAVGEMVVPPTNDLAGINAWGKNLANINTLGAAVLAGMAGLQGINAGSMMTTAEFAAQDLLNAASVGISAISGINV